MALMPPPSPAVLPSLTWVAAKAKPGSKLCLQVLQRSLEQVWALVVQRPLCLLAAAAPPLPLPAMRNLPRGPPRKQQAAVAVRR